MLGDKGDGSPRARATAKQRYATFNADHVPDIIAKNAAFNGNHVLYESKVYSCLAKTVNKGGGSARLGGSPSTAAGDLVAFGCTEEHLLCMIFGCKARGTSHEGPFDHTTGAGWVQASKGHYHDAIVNKQNTVLALIGDGFGGVTVFSRHVLIGLAKKAKDGRDGTKYGALDVSRSFMEFHAGAISTAVVKAEACMLERGAAALEARLVRASPDGGPMVAAAGRV